VPGDAAISLALHRVIEHPPEPPPVLEFAAEREDPSELVRLMWLDSLPELVREELPVEDLMGWLLEKYPERNTADVLGGFSGLVFHRDFQAAFTDEKLNTYKTTDGEIEASPLILTFT
jgi:hypothetical protein